jgi:FAD-dependent urate hydroxylase
MGSARLFASGSSDNPAGGQSVKQLRILIVGGGIAGLATARAFHQRGFRPQIIERAAEWPEAGTGMYMPANGVRALKALGLDAVVTSRGFVITHQRVLNQRGSLLQDIDLKDVWGACGPCLAIPRRDFHSELVKGAFGLPLRVRTAVESIHQQAGNVKATFSDGSSGEFDVIVGADGIRSTVRRLAFDVGHPRYVGQVSWRFVVEGFPEIGAWTVMLGRGKSFLTIPLGKGRVYCYCDIGSPRTEDPTGGDVERLRQLFEGFADPVPRILECVERAQDMYFSPIEEVAQQSSVNGHVVLIGDAAHGMSPNMAEGASLALEDAVVLAETIAAEQSLDESLSSFAARRTPRISWVREMTHRRDRMRALPPAVRDLVLRMAGTRIFKANYRRLIEEP